MGCSEIENLYQSMKSGAHKQTLVSTAKYKVPKSWSERAIGTRWAPLSAPRESFICSSFLRNICMKFVAGRRPFLAQNQMMNIFQSTWSIHQNQFSANNSFLSGMTLHLPIRRKSIIRKWKNHRVRSVRMRRCANRWLLSFKTNMTNHHPQSIRLRWLHSPNMMYGRQ